MSLIDALYTDVEPFLGDAVRRFCVMLHQQEPVLRLELHALITLEMRAHVRFGLLRAHPPVLIGIHRLEERPHLLLGHLHPGLRDRRGQLLFVELAAPIGGEG